MGMRLPKDVAAKVLRQAGLSPLGPDPSEAEFQAALVAEAERLGWECYHTHDSRRSDPGLPDLLLVRPPRLIFAELKSAAGRLRPAQAKWVALLRGVPAVEVFVWRPDMWPEIVKELT
jgi:hypothetical protein